VVDFDVLFMPWALNGMLTTVYRDGDKESWRKETIIILQT